MLNVDPNIILDSQFKKSDRMVSRFVAGQVVLVPLRKNAGELDSIFTLNETGALVWDLLNEQPRLREILEKMVSEYEIDEAEAAQDLLELIAHLVEVGAVERV
jgi:hypothetical protein